MATLRLPEIIISIQKKTQTAKTSLGEEQRGSPEKGGHQNKQADNFERHNKLGDLNDVKRERAEVVLELVEVGLMEKPNYRPGFHWTNSFIIHELAKD